MLHEKSFNSLIILFLASVLLNWTQKRSRQVKKNHINNNVSLKNNLIIAELNYKKNPQTFFPSFNAWLGKLKTHSFTSVQPLERRTSKIVFCSVHLKRITRLLSLKFMQKLIIINHFKKINHLIL